MIKLKYLIFSMLFASSASISEAQEIGFPVIRNYNPKEYNNSTQIFGAIQGARGVFYFGVADGVMEYDGITWRTISNNKQAYSYDLAKDNNGKIYISASNEFGYLDTDRKGNTIYKTLTHLIRDTTFKLGAVWSVKVTSKYVYFRTYNTILQYTVSPEKLQIFKADSNGSFSVDFIYKDVYYTRMFPKGLMKIENNELTQVPKSDFIKDINSLVILPYNPTTVLIPTRTNGLYLFQPNTDASAKNFYIWDSDFIHDNNIYSASAFQNEKFVLGSLKKGAILFDKQGKVLQHYQESNLLQNNEILKVTTDTCQNLWFGLNNGISKTEQGLDLSYWGKEAGLQGIVERVIRHNNTIYIATSTKVYFINSKNKIQEVQNIQTGQSWCFLETKDIKSLFVGISDGIYEIKRDKAVKICFGAHITELIQSAKNPDRIFAIDGGRFISLKYEKGKWMLEGDWKGINDQLDGIIEDENGEIWLGTSRNGVIRIVPNDENVTKPSKVRYYNNNALFNIPFKFKNKIISGSKNGLSFYNSKTDRFEPFCELGEQFCKGGHDITSFKEMPDGKIWICPSENKNTDIGYLRPNGKGGYDWVYAPFRRIPNMSLETFYIEPSGIAWIGGSEGLYRYDMSKDTKDYTQKFNCLIRKITCGSDSLLYGGNASNLQDINKLADLKYELNNLTFEFAAPFFDQEEKTLYSYQLVGYNNEWSKWGRETKKEYSKIHEGKYTFRVKARNVYDVESEIDSCQIAILPPWNRTIWAYIAYMFISITFIWVITRLYSGRLKSANIQLETIVKERTLEITRQKEEILAKNEELSKSNSEKDKFFSILAHDLRGPFNGFLGLTQIMAEDLGDLTHKELHEMAIILEKSAANLFHLLENLLNWSRMQQGQIPFNPIGVQLLTVVEESITIILEQAKIKGVEITVGISDDLSVLAENYMLQTVIRNLVSNALKFTHKGGKVTISASAGEDKNVVVAINDTGIGMSRDMVDNLFQLHVQTGRPGTDGEPSSGLGLVLCKEFIEKNGGKLWVESEVGRGSTFYFTIPLNAPA
ncbi:MAG: ATP-binding protein [Bacteroidia bacterium]|nr:ATP-binding protein [Bacteroidia bacterium]